MEVFTVMKSWYSVHTRIHCAPLVITLYVVFGYMSVMQAKGHVGIIKLQHAFADRIASSKRNTGKGISKEHIELFKTHDRARHGRVLVDTAQFPLGGNASPFVAGIYFTRIRLGTPSKEYYVQVDTGSDLLWLNCNPCTACPRYNNLGMILVPYDIQTSSTSSELSCDDLICSSGSSIVNSHCDTENHCGYSFWYEDRSSSTGYLVEDKLMYSTVLPNNSEADASATIIFGCGYSQSGNLLIGQNVVDGVIGFGQNNLSIVSQLYMQGLAPRVFAHCLEGSEKGGGILVLGNVDDLGIIFTPIVSSQRHYNVNLKGISVNGIELAVDSSIYATTDVQGTIFDSGTTLAYLRDLAYTSFVTAIIKGAPSEAYQLSQPGDVCFLYSGSIDDFFPLVTLHFEGGDMKLRGSHYLIRQAESVDVEVWCIGWQSISSSSNNVLTILGDIVLKDKLVIYDLEKQRIGWVDYDCSSPISVSTTSGKSQSIHPEQLKSDASSRTIAFHLCFLLTVVTMLLTCTFS